MFTPAAIRNSSGRRNGTSQTSGRPRSKNFRRQSPEKLGEIESEKYYKEATGLDGRGLHVPDDLDASICRYQSLQAPLQAKFDRAAYWLSMTSRQWEDSMSASYASLVSAARH